ncbi:hypothetical protein ACG1BZ_05585 [Microbulbifer sp. CNSA002]|uniref:hypothetical protein n=1 Tax=unclassified Microbulbifer TaxID=2619833 RepID=UPI0039B482BC
MKYIPQILAFVTGIAITVGSGLYFLKREVASQAAYMNALAIYQIIDGLEKDRITRAPKTEEWLCHIAFRMEHNLKSVWPKVAKEYVFPAKAKLVSHRKNVGLQKCENQQSNQSKL